MKESTRHSHSKRTRPVVKSAVTHAAPLPFETSSLDVYNSAVASVDVDHNDSMSNVSSMSCNSSINEISEDALPLAVTGVTKGEISEHSLPKVTIEFDRLLEVHEQTFNLHKTKPIHRSLNRDIHLTDDDIQKNKIHSRSDVSRRIKTQIQLDTNERRIQSQNIEVEASIPIKANAESVEMLDISSNGRRHQCDSNVSPQAISAAGTSSCEELSLSEMKSEIRKFKQIISSLTDENSAYRKRDLEQRHRITILLQKSNELQNNSQPIDTEFRKLKEKLEMKSQLAESIMKQKISLEKREQRNQFKIAKLGREVMRIEKVKIELENENETLQKLLNTSREAVLNCSMESSAVTNSILNDSHLDTKSTSTLSHGMIENDVVTIVQKSIANELEATKQREALLLKQLESKCDKQDSIMESLSESQQEAIVYLNKEVNELRSHLSTNRMLLFQKSEERKKAEERIQVLEHENKLVASETIKNRKHLDIARQKLSILSGENACLRDEVKELEESLEKQKKGKGIASEKQAKRIELWEENERFTSQSCKSSVAEEPILPMPLSKRPLKSTVRTRNDSKSETVERPLSINIDNLKTSASNDRVGMCMNKLSSQQEHASRNSDKFSKQGFKKQRGVEEKPRSKEARLKKLTVAIKNPQVPSSKKQERRGQIRTQGTSPETEDSGDSENIRAAIEHKDTARRTLGGLKKTFEDAESTSDSDASIDMVSKSECTLKSTSLSCGEAEDTGEAALDGKETEIEKMIASFEKKQEELEYLESLIVSQESDQKQEILENLNAVKHGDASQNPLKLKKNHNTHQTRNEERQPSNDISEALIDGASKSTDLLKFIPFSPEDSLASKVIN